MGLRFRGDLTVPYCSEPEKRKKSSDPVNFLVLHEYFAFFWLIFCQQYRSLVVFTLLL